MRSIRIWGITIALLGAVLLADGPRAQRLRPEAITRTPSQVEVTNFPAVQGVSGTVNVGNLPAVQTVGGTVAVGNLPLDADGNVRVATSAPSVAPTFQVVKLFEGVVVTVGGDIIRSAPFQIADWHAAFAFVRITSSDGSYNQICPAPIVEEGTDDLFADIDVFSVNGICLPPGLTRTTVVSVPIMGPEIRIRLSAGGQGGATATVDVWLFATQSK